MEDLTQLENTLSNNVTSSIQNEISKLMAWFIVPSIILTLLVILLYLLHVLRRRKIENAILEMRDVLREMKLAAVTPVQPRPQQEQAVTVPAQTTTEATITTNPDSTTSS